jgi:4-amino-4-deoxychorismate lyase
MSVVTPSSEDEPIIWVNGERSHLVTALDRGLAYGDGLFETMRWQCGTVALIPWHLRRLCNGAERLGIPLEMEVVREQLGKVLAEIANVYLKTNPTVLATRVGALKLILTRGAGGQGLNRYLI